MEDEKPVIILVHPLLRNELHIRKLTMEKEIGYKINGGLPVVSKLVALELEKIRTNNKKNINIELHKKKGTKKVDLIKLW